MDLKSILNKVNNHTPTILGSETFSKFAVLIPLVMRDNEINILFEVRSQSLRRQPGEICFPGGRIDDQDKTEKDAAIRETTEELGISKSEILDVHPLDYMVSPFGMIVYPYVGLLKNSTMIKPNPSEVGEVFMVPLTYFLETNPEIYKVNLDIQPEKNFPLNLIQGGQDYKWRTLQMDEYFYSYDNKVIWGLTAKIISHFVEMIRDV
ncbi:NUDIX domain-containing protein [Aquibacillus halophilus]|uniref:NUDIX domain-containing protein n=1 Tax=Aquibacillus halophilus TaxID=930132 RepID=A0A6A8D6S7_9BACI|nr:CoA pyrophosphatase [Aquibacillus halophilus]MRH41314.1 NUDIX domain-containing protein [Aquibacillus halophilus]